MSQAGSTLSVWCWHMLTLKVGAMEVMYRSALAHKGLITDSLLLLIVLNAHTIGGY